MVLEWPLNSVLRQKTVVAAYYNALSCELFLLQANLRVPNRPLAFPQEDFFFEK